ncbi:NAD(P)-dependent oxidoreductase [Arthrobacter antioxidans]|uniref:NAD(P)-dependent oxidoreductase n=1 Tax=Arthrobacter antioxidans TaxID=2895818 RepID=UPI001FFF9D89|nr:NAD(P)H-binding protein [Arthrobacter antioxidans]
MATIAVFGGTGRTGRHVLEQALAAGHEVRALARSASSVRARDPRLTVVEGDVLDADAVDRVVAGSGAVISVLGQVKGSPATLQTDGIRIITDAMARHGVQRIVSLSGGGLPDPAHDRPKAADRIIRVLLKLLSPTVLEDAKGHLRVLRASGLDWTVVRGPRLQGTPYTGVYRVGWVGVDASTSVGRADLAEFLLRQVEDRTFVHQLPMVSY